MDVEEEVVVGDEGRGRGLRRARVCPRGGSLPLQYDPTSIQALVSRVRYRAR